MPNVASGGFMYGRGGSSTCMALQRNLASLEKAKYALATSSGMSAIATILSLLVAGDHLLCIDDIYGGTQRYLRYVLSPLIKWNMMDFSEPEKIKKHI